MYYTKSHISSYRLSTEVEYNCHMNGSSKLGYIPALDGVRGVAILMVLFFHTLFPVFGAGDLGVDVFFVLSGFLITALVVQEYLRTGSVNLLAFYKRRALRLLP